MNVLITPGKFPKLIQTAAPKSEFFLANVKIAITGSHFLSLGCLYKGMRWQGCKFFYPLVYVGAFSESLHVSDEFFYCHVVKHFLEV